MKDRFSENVVARAVEHYDAGDEVILVHIGKPGDPPQEMRRSAVDSSYCILVEDGERPEELAVGEPKWALGAIVQRRVDRKG